MWFNKKGVFSFGTLMKWLRVYEMFTLAMCRKTAAGVVFIRVAAGDLSRAAQLSSSCCSHMAGAAAVDPPLDNVLHIAPSQGLRQPLPVLFMSRLLSFNCAVQIVNYYFYSSKFYFKPSLWSNV